MTVSVLAIEGTDCRLDELGRLADRTRGKVYDTINNLALLSFVLCVSLSYNPIWPVCDHSPLFNMCLLIWYCTCHPFPLGGDSKST